MSKLTVISGVRRVLGCGALAAVTLLAGCASTLSARVTTFQQWPVGVQGEYYRIVPSAEQTGSLEFGAYADMLRASIGATGLREVVQGAQPRFDVRMDYSNPSKQVWTQRYNDTYLNDGWMGPAFGGYYGGWSGWGGGIFYSPPVVSVPVELYRNTLTVTILDQQAQGREVYRASAVNDSEYDNLNAVMPYLMQAIFDDFPGNNGQTRVVKYTLQR